MTDIETTLSTHNTRPADAIEMRLRADLTHLPIIRSVAANVATKADLDLDTIADLRLAVDEACSTLIGAAPPQSMLVCEFGLAERGVRFDGAVPSTGGEPPSTGSFGWQVLQTLTDSARTWIDAENTDGAAWLHIELTMGKPENAG